MTMAPINSGSETNNGAMFSAPPGLEGSLETDPQYSAIVEGIRKSVAEDLEQKITQKVAGGQPLNGMTLEELRSALMLDVEARMAEKVEQMWKKGSQTLKVFQQKQSQKTAALQEELSACRGRQEAMEAEHEKLKSVLGTLAQRFSLLPSVFTGASGPEGLHVDPSGEASADCMPLASPQPEAQTTDPFMTPFTPLDGVKDPFTGDSSGAAPLPAVPPFPFGASPGAEGYPLSSPVATLSLAEALGQEAALKAPLSLASTLSKSPGPAGVKASPPRSGGLADTTDPKVTRFTFTLRKADGASLGLDVSHTNNAKVLQVEGVLSGGAVEAWNRQCANGQPERAVAKNDKIVQVNNVVGDAQAMLKECKDNQLLRLTVIRGNSDEDDHPLTATPERPKDLSKAPSALHPGAPSFAMPSPKASTAQAKPKSPPPAKSSSVPGNPEGFSFNATAEAFVPGKY